MLTSIGARSRNELLLGAALSLALASTALAQSSSRPVNTPLGQVTYTQTTSAVGNGTVTTHTVTPGDNSRVTPYVGATVYDTDPNRTQSNIGFHAGINIPLGSSGSSSNSQPAPSAPANSSGASEDPE